MKNKWYLRLAVMILASLPLAAGALAADPGSPDDPLVTLSYLNETFMDELMGRVEEKIAQRLGGGTGATAAADTFTVVTLSAGQTLTGDIGCEVILRIGSASCVSPSAPGLIDETGGVVLNSGEPLLVNHLYMMTIEGRGVKAGAKTVKLLVRGGYSVA